MLRMYVVQQCFGLSNEGMEDAIYDSQAIQRLIGIDLRQEATPDATPQLKFRLLLETQHLTKTIFNSINLHLSQKGLLMCEGSIVDATLIAAPSSTKNDAGERDPAKHQNKKGNQSHFGMKAHIGVDAESGLVHTVVATAAQEHYSTQEHAHLQGEETDEFADAGYLGVTKREENQGRAVNSHVDMRPGKRHVLPATPFGNGTRSHRAHQGAYPCQGRASVSFGDKPFKHKKFRYRGQAKNAAQQLTLFGLANLMLAKRRLMACPAQGAS